ncbi:hypothetical protein [Deferrisoma sp.]
MVFPPDRDPPAGALPRHLVLHTGSAAVQADLDASYVDAPELARAQAPGALLSGEA